MGHSECSTVSHRRQGNSRFPQRVCLRKGCGCIFDVRSGNQRYCQDPECLRLVRRWQALKRQRTHRQRPEVRERRAAAARDARQRRSLPKPETPAPIEPVLPEAAPDPPSAWSRSTKNFGPICDRVGCYESPRPSSRCEARYCSSDCHFAMQRVHDRERKSLWRKTLAGQIKCRQQAQKRQAARRTVFAEQASAMRDATTLDASDVVLPYRSAPEVAVPLGGRKEDILHDVQNPETTITPRSRPPPA